MSYTEALERLLGELQKLNAKVDALDERLRGLEDNGTEVAPPSVAPATSAVEPPVSRDGAFGPMVQRSDPTRHHRSVRQALALNGARPDGAAPAEHPEEHSGEPEPESTSVARTSHQRALERIRQMKTGAAPSAASAPRVEPVAPEPDPPEPSEPEPDRLRWETAESTGDPAPTELDLSSALAVDLATRSTQD